MLLSHSAAVGLQVAAVEVIELVTCRYLAPFYIFTITEPSILSTGSPDGSNSVEEHKQNLGAFSPLSRTVTKEKLQRN